MPKNKILRIFNKSEAFSDYTEDGGSKPSELPSQMTIKRASHPRTFMSDAVKISNHNLN
jgi:hypothetical protein